MPRTPQCLVVRLALPAVTALALAATARAEEPGPPAPPVAVVQAGSGGYGLASADGASSLFLHWLVQSDAQVVFNDRPPAPTPSSAFALRFAGLQFDATLQRSVHSILLVDFSGGRLTLLDAWLEARLTDWLTVRSGRFQLPIDEEALTPKIALSFLNYSPVSWLLPVRDIGLQLLGTAADGAIAWNVALTNGAAAGTFGETELDSSKEVVGRVLVRPFHASAVAALRELGLNVGASHGGRGGTAASPNTTSLRDYAGRTFFAYRSTAIATGPVTRVNPEVTWSWGPVGLYSDVLWVEEEVSRVSVHDRAWSVVGTVALTGERVRPLTRVAPLRPLDLAHGAFGAVLLTAGGGGVRVGDEAFPSLADPATAARSANLVGGGILWYPVSGIGVYANQSWTRFEAAPGGVRRPDEWLLIGRVEFRM